MSSASVLAAELPKLGEGGLGPRLQGDPGFDIRNLYPPVIEGNPPPRVDDPNVGYDSFLKSDDLFARIKTCDGAALVAFKMPDRNRGWYLGKSYITQAAFVEFRDKLATGGGGVSDVTSKYFPKGEILDADGTQQPVAVMQIDSVEALDALRSNATVDYVEPRCVIDFQLSSFAGCWAGNPPQVNVSQNGTMELSGKLPSGDTVPWPFKMLGVEAAWSLAEARAEIPGAGALVAVVDTGLARDQEEMLNEFAHVKGMPELDYAFQLIPLVADVWDQCDHGTRMAAFATAPENGRSMVGVAKGAGLRAVRIGDGVGHVGMGRKEIGTAIERAAALGATVLTMAWGMPMGSWSIKESIEKVVVRTEVVLLAAAGTNVPSWMSVFPADLVNETVSVSAVSPRRVGFGFPNPAPWLHAVPGLTSVSYTNVDVVGVINDDNEAWPSLGLDNWREVNFGGSSAATAELAGMFALAASSYQARYGSKPTREQLMGQVFSHAHQSDLIEDGNFVDGWSSVYGRGMPDARVAVGGVTSVSIDGPLRVQVNQMFALTATPDGFGPYSYEWTLPDESGAKVVSTNPVLTDSIPAGRAERRYQVAVTEIGTGVVVTERKRIAAVSVVVPPKTRWLVSDSVVVEYAAFLNGNSVTRLVDDGVWMPEGCRVVETLGQEYRKTSGGYVEFDKPLPWANRTDRGFSVSRAATGSPTNTAPAPNQLGAMVHVWHQPWTSIRVAPTYVVSQEDGVDCLPSGFHEMP